MKALVQERYGEPRDVLRVREVDDPVPRDDEVLVRVRAASVHIGDVHGIRGVPSLFRPMYGLRRPKVRIPGTDITGTIEAVGTGGSGAAPPEDYRRARVVRTLRGDHDLVVDGVPLASLGSAGVYPRVCGGGPDRLWYRVRSVDGDRVNGWIAMPLVRPVRP